MEGLRDKSVRRVSCGSLHIVALTDKGHLYAVGKDSFGQCGIKSGELISAPTRINAVSFYLYTRPFYNRFSVLMFS